MNKTVMLVLPAGALLLVCFIVPLFLLVNISFQTYTPTGSLPIFTLENYRQLTAPAYLNVLLVTIRISLVSTFVSVLLGFPVAYYIAHSRHLGVKKILLACMILTFLMSQIARVFAWVLMLGREGVVNSFLLLVGVGRLELFGSEFAVNVGTIHYLAPFAVLTLVGPIRNVEASLKEAAQSLGATRVQTFVTITLPLCKYGIISATLLCFAMGLTMFLTPMMLGGGFVTMLTNAIYLRVMETLNVPFAAAMSILLLVVALIASYGMNRIALRKGTKARM